MKTLSQPKSNRTRPAARRAAAIKAGWPARERNERAIMAATRQCLLVASILASVSDSRAA